MATSVSTSAARPEATAASSPRHAEAPQQGWSVPRWNDPRLPFAAVLTLYGVLGFTFLGFNRSPGQMLTIVASGALLDMSLTYLLRGKKVVPLSAYISCCSLALLLNYSHSSWVLFFPVLLTVGSKYVLTFKGRHVFNPSMFGVSVALLTAGHVITAAPAYQWAGGNLTMSAFLVLCALALFVVRIGRNWLILSFLFFYALQTALRAWILRHHIPPEMLFVGTMASPPFLLFTFYMLTDPATSPKTPRGQVALAFAVSFVDLLLHAKESVFTIFYAALGVGCVKFLWLHGRELWTVGARRYANERLRVTVLRPAATVVALTTTLVALYNYGIDPRVRDVTAGFTMQSLTPVETGIHSRNGQLLEQVDPGLLHVAKWILAVGDAVAVGDYDNDGRLDLFLTHLLKRPEDRAALYRNVGNMRFERVPLPALDFYRTAFREDGVGLPAGATFVDYDGDGDQDLALAVGFGRSRLLRNLLVEEGSPRYVDVSEEVGLDSHHVSLAITFLDYDRDASLDMFVTNALAPYLPDYDAPTPLNIFDLPEPEFEGDRRRFHFMHDGWHDASNGGRNELYRGGDGKFTAVDMGDFGMTDTHWSLAVSTADLNRDGWTDLYVASDFGPDDLYLNRGGAGFEHVVGEVYGEIGKDTYKGMNSSVADFDRNGYLDVYISNVHHSLQAEGSLLWMTAPSDDPFLPRFHDEATQRNALNEQRFGWGAGVGDLNNDGWVDIVQANGMVGDDLDPRGYARKDYWYVNHKLMQSGPEMHTYADMWGDIRGRTIYPNEARRVYLNLGAHGKASFADVAAELGVDDPHNSRGVGVADFDNDGDLDLVITNQHSPVSVYRNALRSDEGTQADTNYVGAALVGNGRQTHRSAIGSQVSITYEHDGEEVTQVAEVGLLGGFSAQRDPRLHFGLGSYDGPVRAELRWYGGPVETTVLQPNRYHELHQGSVSGPHAAVGR